MVKRDVILLIVAATALVASAAGFVGGRIYDARQARVAAAIGALADVRGHLAMLDLMRAGRFDAAVQAEQGFLENSIVVFDSYGLSLQENTPERDLLARARERLKEVKR